MLQGSPARPAVASPTLGDTGLAPCILLHQTIYFNGHGTTQALVVLLIYLAVAAVILIVLDHRRTEARVDTEAAEAAAMAVPIGAAP